MIQIVHDRPQRVAHGDEIDDILILVQRPKPFGRDAVIMPMQPLADIAVERNKVRALKTR